MKELLAVIIVVKALLIMLFWILKGTFITCKTAGKGAEKAWKAGRRLSGAPAVADCALKDLCWANKDWYRKHCSFWKHCRKLSA